MAFKVTCPGCEASYQLRDEKAGRKFYCPKCSAMIEAPEVPVREQELVQEPPVLYSPAPMEPVEDHPAPRAAHTLVREAKPPRLSSPWQILWASLGGAVLLTGLIVGVLFFFRTPTEDEENASREGTVQPAPTQQTPSSFPRFSRPRTIPQVVQIPFSGKPATAPTEPLSAYIPDDAVLAVALNVPRILQSPLAKAIPEDLARFLGSQLPVPPQMVEQVVFSMFLPPEQLELLERDTGIEFNSPPEFPSFQHLKELDDPADHPGRLEPWVLTIRFSEDVNPQTLAESLHTVIDRENMDSRKIEIEGQPCVLTSLVIRMRHREGSREVARYGISAIYMPDPRTAVITSPRMLKYGILAGKAGNGAVAQIFKSGNMDFDGRVILSREAYPEMVQVLQQPRMMAGIPPQWLGLLKLPTIADRVVLDVDFAGETLMTLALRPDGPENRSRLEEFADQMKAVAAFSGSFALDQFQREFPGLNAVRLYWDDLVEGIEVQGTESTVLLTMPAPRESEELIKSLVRELRIYQQRIELSRHGLPLREIAQAFTRFHEIYQCLPWGTKSLTGSVDHSWRIDLLPFLGYYRLHEQYDFIHESATPDNREMLSRMPPIYAPWGWKAESGMTNLRVFTGPGTLFPGDRQHRFQEVSDGLDNTLLAIQVSEELVTPWTSSTELPFDPENPRKVLEPIPPRGLLGVLCNGRVIPIPPDIDNAILKALITPAGGESLLLNAP